MNRNDRKVLIFFILFTLFLCSLALALDKDKVRFQGVLMELDLKNRVIVVNEMTFFWNENTIFSDAKGVPITVDKLKTKSWVYIEGENDKVNKKVAKKVYLLPKYIEKKERDLYPFIQD